MSALPPKAHIERYDRHVRLEKVAVTGRLAAIPGLYSEQIVFFKDFLDRRRFCRGRDENGCGRKSKQV